MKLIKHGRLEVLNKYPFNIDRSKCDVCLPLNSRLFPESRKLPLSSSLMCVTRPARVRNTRSQRSQRPGPALQSPVSELSAGLSLSFSAVSGAVSVGSVPRPLILSHNQGPGKRRHPDIPLSAETKDHTQHSFGDNSSALHSNKRKCCSINSGGGDNWDWS